MSLDPDQDAVNLMAQGHAGGMTIMMERHLRSITGLARAMLGDAMMSEDVAQSVFLKAWLQAPKWQAGSATFLTWMRRVTKNQCLDILRKKGPIYTDAVPDMSGGGNDTVQRLINKDRDAELHVALAALGDNQRAAVSLFYLQDLSTRDTAEALDMSESAVMSLLARARRTLKDHLSPFDISAKKRETL